MRDGTFDVVLYGHFAIDKITTVDEGTVQAPGGAVYYGGVSLARQGYRVAVVTRLSRDDFWRLDELREAGIEVFATEAPQSAGMENIYLSEDRDKRVCKRLGFAGAFTLEEFPKLQAKLQLVIPICAGEINLSALKEIAKRGPVGLDVQGFVRFAEGDDIVFRDWPEKVEGLKCVRFLKADDTEAEVLTGRTDLHQAACELAALGPEEVLLTYKNGLLVYAGGTFYEGEFSPNKVRGRTGRGDTCFTTYCARRLSASPKEAVAYAAAVTSLKLETPGPFGCSTEELEAKLAG